MKRLKFCYNHCDACLDFWSDGTRIEWIQGNFITAIVCQMHVCEEQIPNYFSLFELISHFWMNHLQSFWDWNESVISKEMISIQNLFFIVNFNWLIFLKRQWFQWFLIFFFHRSISWISIWIFWSWYNFLALGTWYFMKIVNDLRVEWISDDCNLQEAFKATIGARSRFGNYQ